MWMIADIVEITAQKIKKFSIISDLKPSFGGISYACIFIRNLTNNQNGEATLAPPF